MSRRAGAALAVVAAVASGCAGPTQDEAEASTPTLTWSACTVPDVVAGVECSTLEVPVDWDDPAGRTITLDLARAPVTGPDRVGAVVMNPGGPGGSGIVELGQALEQFAGLRNRMDVVSWNPRGSDGRYLPLEECVGGPTVRGLSNREEYESAAAEGAAAMQPCRDHDPELFDNLDSATQARDMDAIRAALGEEQLNFFGNSYGGVLGASYARLFPKRVRTMFLDSIVDHVSGVDAANQDAYRAFEALFDRFVQWCRSTPECAQHGHDAERVWQDLIGQAERNPIPVGAADPPVTFDGDALTFYATQFVVREEWPAFSAAIATAVAGDATPFDMFGDGPAPVLPALALATQCADGFRFDGYRDFARASRDNAPLSPNFAGERENYTAACAGWPAPVANPPGPLPSALLPPFLGAGPVLEYSAVHAVVGQAPGSVSIRFDGTGHGLYLNEGNSCVIDHADRYLTDRVLPAPDRVCPPDER